MTDFAPDIDVTKLRVEQDGYTLCIIEPYKEDPDGVSHCFRIDRVIGAEIKKRIELYPQLVAAAQLALDYSQILSNGAPLEAQLALSRAVVNLRKLLAEVIV